LRWLASTEPSIDQEISMARRRIPSQALILVCDGRKALFLRNIGDAMLPDLRVTSVLRDKANPSTALQGTDRPGRTFDRASGRHSAYAQTDWHTLEEEHFAHEIVSALERLDLNGEIDHLLLVAPPKTLAELRATLPLSVKDKILDEIHKDLTKHPVHEIERLLTDG
jgi:protein required for attachment to host cells